MRHWGISLSAVCAPVVRKFASIKTGINGVEIFIWDFSSRSSAVMITSRY